MTFGEAIAAIERGSSVTRSGFTDQGTFVFLMPMTFMESTATAASKFFPGGTTLIFQPYLVIRTAQGSIAPYSPTQTDILSEDWIVVQA
jgi:hypothetical protein